MKIDFFMDCKVMHSESLGQKTWKVLNNNKKCKTNLLKIYVCVSSVVVVWLGV